MSYTFKAFGLNINSEFPFQGIEIPEKGFFDVEVINGMVPEQLNNRLHQGISFESNATEYILNVPSVAKYYIKEGQSITIEATPEAELREIELFFLGSAMAVLLMQRGIVPFHGSAFQKDDKCVIISGKSGAGKTTLLRYFINQGYKGLTDDVCALSVIDAKVRLTPSYPSSKIWGDVMKQYKINIDASKKIRPEIDKYKYNFVNDFVHTPLEIEAVYILNNKNITEFEIKEVKGFDKFSQLKNNLYRPKYPEAMGKLKETFSILNQLANQAQIYHLTRSSSMELFDDFNAFAQSKIIG